MLTYGGLKQHILLALGGQPSIVIGVSRDQRIAEIVNQAGNYLFTKAWRFRERTARPLSIVANQDWIALPSDADEIVSLIAKGGLGWRIELTTPDQIEVFRNTLAPQVLDSVYYAAMSRPWAEANGTTPLAAGTAFPAVRLDIYPTPVANQPDAMIMRYRAGWTPVSEDNGSVTPITYIMPVPSYVEALLIAYCRAFAVSYEDEGLAARLIEIDNGPILNAAAIKDGIAQRDYGRLTTSRARAFVSDPFRYRNGFLGNPS